jgi:hypothetical protein
MAMAMSAMDKEIKEYIDKNKAINTVKKTKSDLNIWFRWCKTVNEKRKLEEISVEELNSLLGHFFINIKKQNGEEYEPNSLTSLQSSIDRHLREAGRMYSILFDREFETSRKALEAKRKKVKDANRMQLNPLPKQSKISCGQLDNLEEITHWYYSIQYGFFVLCILVGEVLTSIAEFALEIWCMGWMTKTLSFLK